MFRLTLNKGHKIVASSDLDSLRHSLGKPSQPHALLFFLHRMASSIFLSFIIASS